MRPPIRLLPLLLLPTLAEMPAGAQEASPPTHVYEAFFRISYADLDAWNRVHHLYSVPILEEMREAGDIQGWSHWQHHTGGEYNIRLAVRTFDWAAIDAFWAEYLARMEATVPTAEAANPLIQAHHDEIWNIVEIHNPNGVSASHLYEATFRYGFGDLDEWNRLWSEVVGPMLDEAVGAGMLGGWIRLDHNTGGSHNAKVLYLFEDWDHIDDMFAWLLTELPARHPEDAARLFALFRAHDDRIWVPTVLPGSGAP